MIDDKLKWEDQIDSIRKSFTPNWSDKINQALCS